MAKKTSSHKVAQGLGLAALAAAAAGVYYFYGPTGAKHKKALKSWAVKAKGEVMENLENMKELSQAAYKNAVDNVLDKYRRVKNIDPKELAILSAELKGHWNRISKHLNAPKARKKTSKKK